MSKIYVKKVDAVHLLVDAEESILMEIRDRFTFSVPNARHMPTYKIKMWDGKIRLFNPYIRTLYAGLWGELESFASQRNYEIEYTNAEEFLRGSMAITEDECIEYLESLELAKDGDRIIPQTHQLDAFQHCINHGRSTLISPTASGKSLILYSLVRFYMDSIVGKGKKILIVVPAIQLINQLRFDFKDYSGINGWDTEANVHTIYDTLPKKSPKPIFLCTWQGIYKMPKVWFDQFDVVLFDETHMLKSKCLTGIGEKLKNTHIRHGCTGTLDKSETNQLVIQGLLGPKYVVTTTKELMDKKLVSKAKIMCLVFKYPDEIRKIAAKFDYHKEFDFIKGLPARNEYIRQLSYENEGNTLILCAQVDNQLVPLCDKIQSELPVGKKSYMICGKIKPSEREEIRVQMNKDEGAILAATYQTMSVGVNISRLHHLILASPYKSNIRILQSIGRTLRLAKDKECAKIWDLSDDLRWKSTINTTYRHFIERLTTFTEEEFDYEIVEVPLELTQKDLDYVAEFSK